VPIRCTLINVIIKYCYSIFSFVLYGNGSAETGIARDSLSGTITEVQRVGFRLQKSGPFQPP
jgi:hypothetical protein